MWSRRIAQNKNEKIRKILPWSIGQNLSIFFVHTLGNATTSCIHSEISWPLALASHHISHEIACFRGTNMCHSEYLSFQRAPDNTTSHTRRTSKLVTRGSHICDFWTFFLIVKGGIIDWSGTLSLSVFFFSFFLSSSKSSYVPWNCTLLWHQRDHLLMDKGGNWFLSCRKASIKPS